MTKWNTEKQFCSFLGLYPNHSISGGKVLNRATRKSNFSNHQAPEPSKGAPAADGDRRKVQ